MHAFVMPVDGVFVSFDKWAEGESFILSVKPTDAPRVMSLNAVAFHERYGQGHPDGYYFIGRVCGRGSTLDLGRSLDQSGISMVVQVSDDVQCAPSIADTQLADFVLRAATALDRRLANIGQWPSFVAYLEAVLGNAVPDDYSGPLPRFPFQWIVGHLDEPGGVFPLRVYSGSNAGNGLYVNREGLIPIYSSDLHGAIAADALAETGGSPFVNDVMECIGCFLNGASGELGPQTVRGALLDDQWRIEFGSCAARSRPGTAPNASHFWLHDRGTKFVLTGCNGERVYPRFVAAGWRNQPPIETCCVPAGW